MLTGAGDAKVQGGRSVVSSLEFVARTKIPSPSGRLLSLCHLLHQSSVWGVPLTTSSVAYVLAENECATKSYYTTSVEELSVAKSAGAIERGVPLAPSLDLARRARNFILQACLGLLGTYGILNVMRARRLNQHTVPDINTGDSAFVQAVGAMCHVAKADGQLIGDKIQVIAFTSKKLLGKAMPRRKIAKMIEASDSDLQATDFSQFSEGLDETQRRTVMRGVLMVAVSDGIIAESEQDFISRLAKASKIPQSDVRAMLREEAPFCETETETETEKA